MSAHDLIRVRAVISAVHDRAGSSHANPLMSVINTMVQHVFVPGFLLEYFTTFSTSQLQVIEVDYLSTSVPCLMASNDCGMIEPVLKSEQCRHSLTNSLTSPSIPGHAQYGLRRSRVPQHPCVQPHACTHMSSGAPADASPLPESIALALRVA